MNNAYFKSLDLAHIWHPCTQMKDHENVPLIPIKKANGMYLYDFDGAKYMDCVSSWWVNLFGHCNGHIASAIKSQVDELAHIILAGFHTSKLLHSRKDFALFWEEDSINASMRIMAQAQLK